MTRPRRVNLAFWLTAVVALFWWFAPQSLPVHWLLFWTIVVGLVTAIVWAMVCAAADIIHPRRRPWWREDYDDWKGGR